jgi:hypothetical protein
MEAHMRILLATGFMVSWSGSEIVILELAEAFRADGHEVTIVAEVFRPPLAPFLEELGCTLIVAGDLEELDSFDLIWSQHKTLVGIMSRLLNRHGRVQVPPLASVHLSPYEPLEAPLPAFLRLTESEIWTNSRETAIEVARRCKVDEGTVHVFHNAAPTCFWTAPTPRAEQLGRLLVVSNHVPSELSAALDILRDDRGVEIVHLGMKGSHRRIIPEDLMGMDAVVTIGKTVVYALAAGCPAYLYDRFGGDGWLDPEDLAFQSDNNFSGRPRCRRLDADVIAREIVSGYPAARDNAAQALPHDLGERFRLEPMLEALINRAEARGRVTITLEDWSAADLDGIGAMATFVAEALVRRYHNADLLEKNRELHRQLSVRGRLRRLRRYLLPTAG